MMGYIIAFNPCSFCDKRNMCSMCELDMYRKGSLANNKWISVEERLPDEQGHFLIVDKEGQMNTAFYTPRFGWLSHFRIRNITHWIPLPEPPKKGGGE
jgi:hypothetical protein